MNMQGRGNDLRVWLQVTYINPIENNLLHAQIKHDLQGMIGFHFSLKKTKQDYLSSLITQLSGFAKLPQYPLKGP
jgi:hypothetical protein